MDLFNDAMCNGVRMYSVAIGTFHSVLPINNHSNLGLQANSEPFSLPRISSVFPLLECMIMSEQRTVGQESFLKRTVVKTKKVLFGKRYKHST